MAEVRPRESYTLNIRVNYYTNLCWTSSINRMNVLTKNEALESKFVFNHFMKWNIQRQRKEESVKRNSNCFILYRINNILEIIVYAYEDMKLF